MTSAAKNAVFTGSHTYVIWPIKTLNDSFTEETNHSDKVKGMQNA
jgi:hypothetical protein